jgi:hypothetical protein
MSKKCISDLFKTNSINILCFIMVGLFCLYIVFVLYKKRVRDRFENNPTTSSNDVIPSYWYKYFKSDTRSKCFDCDATSKYRHGAPCFDCEIPGGRGIDPNLNKVLTR